MISSHFSFTYGNNYNWLILAVISIAGASVDIILILEIENNIKFGYCQQLLC